MLRNKGLTLKILSMVIVIAFVLAACAPAAGDEEVEVFSWWTGGGEAAGLDAMIEVFNEKNPDIEFVNSAVAGGAGTNARAVLATRLSQNEPPDSWQGHAGQELIGTYVKDKKISFTIKRVGWM
jgi:glucose/mannose transport system substrate-binding protein